MTPLADKTQIVRRICDALAAGDTHKASEIARRDYPFTPRTTAQNKRYIRDFAATSVVLRDGFVAGTAGTQSRRPQTVGKRSPLSEYTKTLIFLRDGFVDQYAGTQLLFPGVIRLLWLLLRAEFPWQKNWNPSVSHIILWDFSPTVDHVDPISGSDAPDRADNWVTTSMMLNNVKGRRMLDDLGWTRFPPGDPATWDGLTSWFLAFISRSPEHLDDKYIKKWHSAAKRLMKV